MLVQEVSAVSSLFSIQGNAEPEVLDRSALLGCDRDWASDLVIDPLPCAKGGAHRGPDEELRSLLLDLLHGSIAHDL